jgi:hypothetical protein
MKMGLTVGALLLAGLASSYGTPHALHREICVSHDGMRHCAYEMDGGGATMPRCGVVSAGVAAEHVGRGAEAAEGGASTTMSDQSSFDAGPLTFAPGAASMAAAAVLGLEK